MVDHSEELVCINGWIDRGADFQRESAMMIILFSFWDNQFVFFFPKKRMC